MDSNRRISDGEFGQRDALTALSGGVIKLLSLIAVAGISFFLLLARIGVSLIVCALSIVTVVMIAWTFLLLAGYGMTSHGVWLGRAGTAAMIGCACFIAIAILQLIRQSLGLSAAPAGFIPTRYLRLSLAPRDASF